MLPAISSHLFGAANVPVGTVLPYAGRTGPLDPPLVALADPCKTPAEDDDEYTRALLQSGWVPCDGRQLKVSEYPALARVLSFAFGGDGAGLFNVPDLRARFVRGVAGKAADRDPGLSAKERISCAPSGYPVNAAGSFEPDAFQGHQHDYQEAGTALKFSVEKPTTDALTKDADSSTAEYVQDGDYGGPRVSAETRPANVYLNFIIRAR